MIGMGSKVKLNDKGRHKVSKEDEGKVFEVRSEPFEICGTMCVLLKGKRGGYAIDALTEVEEKQEIIREWILCEERLPQNSETDSYDMQLVTLDNGDVCLGVYRHNDREWLTRMSEGETIYSNKHKVIAWQPLPEPYQPKGE